MTVLEHISYLAGLVAVGFLVWRAVRRGRRNGTVVDLRRERRKRGLKAANRG